MAVGDVISAIWTGSHTFQPAVGVEVIIMYVNANGGSGNWGMTDGTNNAVQHVGSWATSNNYGLTGQLQARIPINNTNYFSASNYGGYSGIQIK